MKMKHYGWAALVGVAVVVGCGSENGGSGGAAGSGLSGGTSGAGGNFGGSSGVSGSSSGGGSGATGACLPTTCNGCCDAQGVCQSGLTSAACGQVGQSCVDCQGAACNNGSCEGCQPTCQSATCGDADGCGGVCKAGSGCCTPKCTQKACGAPDGCGGVCTAGSGCLKSCSAGGLTLKHGESKFFFSKKVVPFGSSCFGVRQKRTCTDGKLSGSYAFATCAVQKVRILVWNILVSGWEPNHITHWTKGRREKVISLAKAAQADIMLLQEVTPKMFNELKSAFGATYKSHSRHVKFGTQFGNAIFSKLVMTNLGGFDVDKIGRNCASAVIRGQNFYSCHLPAPNVSDSERIAAAKSLASQIKSPLVLGADLNTQGNLGIYQIVKGNYNGCGKGVDHLITNQTCNLFKVIEPKANGYPSDHPGLVFTVPK